MDFLDPVESVESQVSAMEIAPQTQSKKRRLAHVEKINKINPIFLKAGPNGEKVFDDKYVLAEVLNWKVVVPKSDFKEGDSVIYCEIDSIMPDTREFQFLKEKDADGLHIKTRKINNQISQGALFPISLLDDYKKPADFKIAEGVEVTEILGITKYDPPAKPVKANANKPKPQKAEALSFPSFIEQTDEERIQNLPKIFSESESREMTYYVTEKVDGMSSTYYFKDGKFGVCSRNTELVDQSNDYWRMAIQYKLQEKMEKYGKNIALQGEIIGAGIIKNRYNVKGKMLKLYSVFDIDNQQYVDFETFEKTMKDLGLETVPILDRAFKLPASVDKLLEYADALSVLNYTDDKEKNPTNLREGVVLRSIVNKPERISFKAISNKFLLEKNE